MQIETLNAMNEGMYFNLLMMIKIIVLVSVFLATIGFVIYLAGTAWFCLVETRRSKTAPRTARRVALSSKYWTATCVPNILESGTSVDRKSPMEKLSVWEVHYDSSSTRYC